jgi:hypothetical protein
MRVLTLQAKRQGLLHPAPVDVRTWGIQLRRAGTHALALTVEGEVLLSAPCRQVRLETLDEGLLVLPDALVEEPCRWRPAPLHPLFGAFGEGPHPLGVRSEAWQQGEDEDTPQVGWHGATEAVEYQSPGEAPSRVATSWPQSGKKHLTLLPSSLAILAKRVHLSYIGHSLRYISHRSKAFLPVNLY